LGGGAVALAERVLAVQANACGGPAAQVGPSAESFFRLLALTLSPLKWYHFATFCEYSAPRHTTP